MEKFFSIGELKISLLYDIGPYKIFIDEALETFTSESVETPDIRFRIDTESPFPLQNQYSTLFTSHPNGLWTILEDCPKTHYLVVLQNTEKGVPYRIVITDRRFSDFLIYSKPNQYNDLHPLEYPVADLSVTGYININKIGIILHSACISLNGKGCLFAGISGSGKSTISQIWQTDKDVDVLTDERVLIRQFREGIWAFGTPWHGTERIHKNKGTSIEHIFFIKHGKTNKANRISKIDAANRLIVRCFPSFWNREGLTFALDFCLMIASGVKCYELEFVNNTSIIGYIKSICC